MFLQLHTYIQLLKNILFQRVLYHHIMNVWWFSYEFFKVTLKNSMMHPDLTQRWNRNYIKNVLKRGRAVLVKFTKWSRNRKSGHLFGLADASGMQWRYFDFCWTRRRHFIQWSKSIQKCLLYQSNSPLYVCQDINRGFSY